MRVLTLSCFYGYVAALLLAGGAGIFVAEWELATLYRIDFGALNEEARASLTNQYRYLKSIELGFGIFCVVFRREIFSTSSLHRLFLFILFVGVGARLLSVTIDGLPHWAYLGFMFFEFMTGIVVMIYTRNTLEEL